MNQMKLWTGLSQRWGSDWLTAPGSLSAHTGNDASHSSVQIKSRPTREREKYFPKQLLSGLAIKTCYFMPTARRSNSELGPLGCPPIQHCAIYKWTIMAAFKREWLAEIDWRKRGITKLEFMRWQLTEINRSTQIEEEIWQIKSSFLRFVFTYQPPYDVWKLN